MLAFPSHAALVCMLAVSLPSIVPTPLPAQLRELSWPAFEVQAQLDSTGRLHVRERQTMRFDGFWNGGERIFDVRFGQQFSFHRLLRVDSLTGTEVALREGDLEAVDEYSWAGGKTLRWRSRLPEDPLFRNTVITYILEYSYANILVPTDEGYRLDHEFAFRDREGDIENFTLSLTIDPAWQRPSTFTGQWREGPFPPGIAFVVDIPLAWQGAGSPSGVRQSPSRAVRLALAAALLIGVGSLTGVLIARERRLGKFQPLVPPERVDEAWIREHVLSIPAEVAGAAWDESIGSAEVSATLARMVAEQKLKSEVTTTKVWFITQHVLHLELLVSRSRLIAQERALVDALFMGSATRTSTDAVRKRYASTGFDPVACIRAPLKTKLSALPGADEPKAAAPSKLPTMLLLATAVALLVWGGARDGATGLIALAAATACVPIYGIARGLATLWRRRVAGAYARMLDFLLPMMLLVGGALWLLFTGQWQLGALSLGGLVVLVLALHNSVNNAARSPYSATYTAFRKQLAAGREYFRRELRKAEPQLQQEWYPHMLAFGLGPHVDRWFKSFGAAATASHAAHRVSSSNSSVTLDSSGSGSSWGGFGGGGAFAGAGATVAFSAALSGMSSSVSPPGSSSSSGGSSSSSGGSSGGGGGGGW